MEEGGCIEGRLTLYKDEKNMTVMEGWGWWREPDIEKKSPLHRAVHLVC